ncbi:hypothetical protein E2562_015223 [Oryza meyeriana var. granulata]|uniref:Uncharacterized protein n=1 Tax=Oryza meyeriana var. granulata TaxID=110450 RepID=A0A6G1EWY7_9ORYZ|nr:hypothetical protein E2562_015223 [Oryza meyeriana var. granulata]
MGAPPVHGPAVVEQELVGDGMVPDATGAATVLAASLPFSWVVGELGIYRSCLTLTGIVFTLVVGLALTARER